MQLWNLYYIIILLVFPPHQLAFAESRTQAATLQSTGIADADELFKRSETALEQGNTSLAMELAVDAETLFAENKDMEGVAQTYLLRTNILIKQQKTGEAFELMTDALHRFPESSQTARYYFIRGNIQLLEHAYLKAVEEYNTALQYTGLLPEEETNALTARIRHNLALMYSNIGRTELALQNFIETINHAEAASDSTVLTMVFNNLGMAYGQNEDHEKARYYLERSLQLAKERNSHVDMYRAYINLGNVFTNTGQYEDALANFNNALEVLSVFDPGASSHVVIHNIGRVLTEMQRYSEAEEFLFQSLELSREQGAALGEHLSSLALGQMYTEQGRFQDAAEHLNNAEELAKNLPNASRRLNVAEAMHHLHAQNNNFEEAYRQLVNYAALADSLNEAEHSQALANAESYLELKRQGDINQLLMDQQTEQEQRLQAQRVLIGAGLLVIILISLLLYQVKKTAREKEAILKQLENQKKELEGLNKSKDRLFGIVSHDLRSTLMSMQSMLSLIKGDVLSGREVKELVPLLEASFEESSNVMEDLLAWTQWQMSEIRLHLEPINITNLLEEVTRSQTYIADKKNITLNVTAPEVPPIKADYNAIKLVLRNLISNAIKFSNRGGHIFVSATEKPEHVVIEISDSGIGIPDDLHDKIFDYKNGSRKGTDNEKGTGFGLSLSKEFVERMNGRMDFESKEGHGATFFVEIPKK